MAYLTQQFEILSALADNGGDLTAWPDGFLKFYRAFLALSLIHILFQCSVLFPLEPADMRRRDTL